MPLWRGASWIVNQSTKRFFPLIHLVKIIRNFIFERRNSGGKNNYFEKDNRTRERSNTNVLLFRKFQFIRGKISWFNVSSSTVETKDRMF